MGRQLLMILGILVAVSAEPRCARTGRRSKRAPACAGPVPVPARRPQLHVDSRRSSETAARPGSERGRRCRRSRRATATADEANEKPAKPNVEGQGRLDEAARPEADANVDAGFKASWRKAESAQPKTDEKLPCAPRFRQRPVQPRLPPSMQQPSPRLRPWTGYRSASSRSPSRSTSRLRPA